jgi:rhamnose utilization protein RhaD (predicted bifunctional aldolase and dehydrogenase)/NAD(P)-dependent dehydrogenase (short-subunit alcohol dehydrogenase family)
MEHGPFRNSISIELVAPLQYTALDEGEGPPDRSILAVSIALRQRFSHERFSMNKTATRLALLSDLWDENVAGKLDEPELLRYRSNLLGADLRITNFGGGNTSSKISQQDPLDGSNRKVLWVKGSGGDLGSIHRNGFATLYLDKLLSLENFYRGADLEDEMVGLYPLCTFGLNPVSASIDTPLHAFLPFNHVDHLHPDWGIALAASANGLDKLAEFNARFGHKIIWIPWQRPGFELAMMLKRAVESNRECDGVVLGGHGLFTWGDTQRECYLSTIGIIDQLGQFVLEHIERRQSTIFGGARYAIRADARKVATEIFPYLRGRVSEQRKLIGTFSNPPEVFKFVNSNDAEKLAFLGTSCPDHFLRTKVRPLFVNWDPTGDITKLRAAIDEALSKYRRDYADYYEANADQASPAQRDANPTVLLIPGVGQFSFGKNKAESRITGEFYVNAIHVMEGAAGLGDSGDCPTTLPQAGSAAASEMFSVHDNYVALPAGEAFRIEYWALEEAKLRRQPAEKELSRQIALVVGGGSGIGREVVRIAAERGAHVVVADLALQAAEEGAIEAQQIVGKEAAISTGVDIRSRESIRAAIEKVIQTYGGLDIVVNTAALFPSSTTGVISDKLWSSTLEVNVTANYLLVDEIAKILADQNLDTSVVLTSSANAVVPKRGSEAYDASKAALSHLVREFAISLAPKVRVNGISPATVVKGSTMFPRDRVLASLRKYGLTFQESMTEENLRTVLAEFYAQRTLTHKPIDPADCARAILFLAGPQARCTSGHLIPVDGGLTEAFLR